MFNIENYIRPHLKDLVAYSSARDEFSGQAKVFLDANENAEGSVVAYNLNRYPDPYQWETKQAVSTLKKVPAKNIFLGNGSDEPIDLMIRLFCEPQKDRIVITSPTYGMYKVSASINHVEVLDIPLDSKYQLNPKKILEDTDDSCKLLFLCSPNNPTGNLLQEEAIETILEKFQGLVVVDEAYIDFANCSSWTTRLENFPNLIVLQTFSKAWGLAGLRLGMAFASEEIVQLLNKIKPPYNLNSLTQEVALQAVKQEAKKNEQVRTTLALREQLQQSLHSFSFVQKVYPSDANFLLIKTDHANLIYQKLLEQGIVIRNRSNVKHCEGGLRISIGTASENEQLIQALQSIQLHITS